MNIIFESVIVIIHIPELMWYYVMVAYDQIGVCLETWGGDI